MSKIIFMSGRSLGVRKPARRGRRRSDGRNAFGLPGLRPVVSAGLVSLLFSAAVGLVWHYVERSENRSGESPSIVATLPDDDRATADEEPLPVGYRAIDGVAQYEEGWAEQPYFAMMIDNITAARPQHGIGSASVVYVAPAEAGITRLLAIFPADFELERIGPIRSARPYYVELAAEYEAVYGHVGGSPESLDLLRAGAGVHDLNQYFHGSLYWRDSNRYAPHNVYTSSERLAEYADERDWSVSKLPAWKYKSDLRLEDRPEEVAPLFIDARYEAYQATWEYDRESNSFARRQGEDFHVDAITGEAVSAKNVVVMFTDVSIIDNVGRRRIRLSGTGDALIALDGRVYAGSWEKQSGRTRFYDASGNEIELNRGASWVEIVPIGTTVTY